MELTERQWQRLAYGAAHEIIRQVLDNGELPAVAYEEYMPSDWHGFDTDHEETEFTTKLQQVIEGLVMSDLFEEAGKRD